MKLLSIWQGLGSYIVPSLAFFGVIFTLFFIKEWRNYLNYIKKMDNHVYDFSSTLKLFLWAKKNESDYHKKSFLWQMIFLSRYKTISDRLLVHFKLELGKITFFDRDEHTLPFDHNSFTAQWEDVFNYFFEFQFMEYKLRKNMSHWSYISKVSNSIQSKIAELFSKKALYVLRTKGYLDFSEFLGKEYEFSKKLPSLSPYSFVCVICVKAIKDNSAEIMERLSHELNGVLSNNFTQRVLILEKLRDSFVLKNYKYSALRSISGFMTIEKKILGMLDDSYCDLAEKCPEETSRSNWLGKVIDPEKKERTLRKIYD